MSEVIANTSMRDYQTKEGFTINEYTEKLSFQIYPLSATQCGVSLFDGAGDGSSVYLSLKDAEDWFTRCLQKIKEFNGEQ